MGLLQEKWDEEQCRFEQGIFFANDEYVGLTRNPDGSFQAGARSSLQSLIDKEPEGWAGLDAACECSNDDYIVVGGGGSYEGEGFVALWDQAQRDLKWLIRLHDIEVVTKVAMEGDVIQAIAKEYPYNNSLTIPIAEPQAVSVDYKYDV